MRGHNSCAILYLISMLFLSSPLPSHSFAPVVVTKIPSETSISSTSTNSNTFDEPSIKSYTTTTDNTISHYSPLTSSSIATKSYEIGDVIDIHHAFCHTPPDDDNEDDKSDQQSYLKRLSGVFRSFPCDDTNFHLGAFMLEPSPEPNCYLAPSTDGGQTRRVIAISPVEIGQSYSVPFSFEFENQRKKIETAIEISSSKERKQDDTTNNNDYVQDLGDGRGRGVYAGRDIEVGELVAEWRYQMVSVEDVPLGMKDYMYESRKVGKYGLVYGHGMLYNHGSIESYNLSWEPPADYDAILTGTGTMPYHAVRPIRKGEELLVSYGEKYWKSRGIIPQ